MPGDPVFDRTVWFFGDLSGQKYDAKFLADLENCTKFGQLFLSKIIKIVATSCHISRLKCTKFDSGPAPAGGAYSAPPDPLAGFKGPTSKGKGKGEGREREGLPLRVGKGNEDRRGQGEGTEGKGRAGMGREGRGGEGRGERRGRVSGFSSQPTYQPYPAHRHHSGD